MLLPCFHFRFSLNSCYKKNYALHFAPLRQMAVSALTLLVIVPKLAKKDHALHFALLRQMAVNALTLLVIVPKLAKLFLQSYALHTVVLRIIGTTSFIR